MGSRAARATLCLSFPDITGSQAIFKKKYESPLSNSQDNPGKLGCLWENQQNNYQWGENPSYS